MMSSLLVLVYILSKLLRHLIASYHNQEDDIEDDGDVLYVSVPVPGGPQSPAATTTATKLQDGASTAGV